MDRLNRGVRTYPAGVSKRDIEEVFCTDAACNEDCVVLGGWFLHLGHDTKTAPELTIRKNEGTSSWASCDFGDLLKGPCLLRTFRGETDNMMSATFAKYKPSLGSEYGSNRLFSELALGWGGISGRLGVFSH